MPTVQNNPKKEFYKSGFSSPPSTSGSAFTSKDPHLGEELAGGRPKAESKRNSKEPKTTPEEEGTSQALASSRKLSSGGYMPETQSKVKELQHQSSGPLELLPAHQNSNNEKLEIVPITTLRSSVSPLEDKHSKLNSQGKVHEEKENNNALFPVSWPVPQWRLDRRRSCELTHRILPCIQKVTAHLYELEDRLEYLLKKNSLTERPSVTSEGKEEVTTEWSNSRSLSVAGDESRYRVQSSCSGATLEIRGAGYKSVGTSCSPVKAPSPEFGNKVLEEILLILGRLETDRVNCEHALAHERQRVLQLRQKIDEFALRRLFHLPIAVQAEHEACAYDIQELKWHCSFKTRTRDRCQEKVQKTESTNKCIKDEIDYISDHRPFAEEKVDDERREILQIQQYQTETDIELQQALAKLKANEWKYNEHMNEADKEKDTLDKKLDLVRAQLNSATAWVRHRAQEQFDDELSQCMMYHTSYVHTLNDIRDRLKEMAEESEMLDKRLERVSEVEKVQKGKVEKLKKKIKDQEIERRKLLEENTKIRSDREKEKTALESQNAKLDMENKKRTQVLRERIAGNRTMEREIRQIKKRINEVLTNRKELANHSNYSAKQKSQDEKAVKRSANEMDKILREIDICHEEKNKVRLVNEKLKTTLEREKEKSEKTEENLQTNADSLKKQLKDESHARTVLQARIAADTSDLVRTQADTERKRNKATKRAEEIEKLLENIRGQKHLVLEITVSDLVHLLRIKGAMSQEKVNKMKKIHNERNKVITELNNLLEKVEKQFCETENKLRSEIDQLTPKEKGLKDEVLDHTKQLDQMKWRTDAIEKRMQDMASSTIMMNRVLLSTQEAIEKLNEELNELRIQLEAGQCLGQTLQQSLEQVQERCLSGNDGHLYHMKERERVLNDQKDGLQRSLDRNRELAQSYNRIQESYLNEKDKLFNVYETVILSQDSLRDKKELFDFRGRLHKALESYYKLRGLQTRAGLARFELLTEENGKRLTVIKDNLKTSIDNISRFLEANNKSHHSIRLKAEEMIKTPQAASVA